MGSNLERELNSLLRYFFFQPMDFSPRSCIYSAHVRCQDKYAIANHQRLVNTCSNWAYLRDEKIWRMCHPNTIRRQVALEVLLFCDDSQGNEDNAPPCRPAGRQTKRASRGTKRYKIEPLKLYHFVEFIIHKNNLHTK